MASTPTTTLRRISPLYTVYFLYVEPVLALGGAFVCLTDPARFLSSTVPEPTLQQLPSAALAVTPVLRLLIINLGSMYAMFAVVQAVVLRLSRDRAVWLGVCAAFLCSDLGHGYGLHVVAPGRLLEATKWNSDEQVVFSTFWAGAVLRLLFVLGVGRS